MEKVVEEIRKERCKTCLFLRSLAEDKCGGSKKGCREQIRWDIGLTLMAVRDGKVKIPGEARRTWLDEFEGYCEEEYGTHRVIILFPEDLARYNEEAEAKRRRDEKAG